VTQAFNAELAKVKLNNEITPPSKTIFRQNTLGVNQEWPGKE
jgi:hypothetical protein